MFRSTRRRSESEPFWRDLIDRWKAFGQSVAAFCTGHRVSQATFYSWRKRLAAGGRRTALPAPTFAPVRVVPDPRAEVICLHAESAGYVLLPCVHTNLHNPKSGMCGQATTGMSAPHFCLVPAFRSEPFVPSN